MDAEVCFGPFRGHLDPRHGDSQARGRGASPCVISRQGSGAPSANRYTGAKAVTPRAAGSACVVPRPGIRCSQGATCKGTRRLGR
jgi:hypothetical protein